MTYHTCFAFEQIFVATNGDVQACCMAQKPFLKLGDNAGDLLRKKKNNNLQIMLKNDASACWAACPSRSEATSAIDPYQINKIVVATNTFCPLRCNYCSLAYAFGDAEWENGNCGPDLNIPDNHWRFKDTNGAFIPPVATKGNDLPSLVKTLENVLQQIPKGETWWVEFSGGDTAFHPEFNEALEMLASRNVFVSYLSSGVVPPAAREAVLKHIPAGRLYVTISADAATAPTWTAIKRRPARVFDQIREFVKDIASLQIANQVAIKFIVMNENAAEAGAFIPSFAEIGVRKFVVSEYRSQPVHFVKPPDDAIVKKACADALHSFRTQTFAHPANLYIIGLESYFGGHRELHRAPSELTAAAAAGPG